MWITYSLFITIYLTFYVLTFFNMKHMNFYSDFRS